MRENHPDSLGQETSPRPGRIPHDVWAISFTSFFSDWGYEMILPVLPFFLIYVLFTTPFVVGLIDGLAQFGQSGMSELSGMSWAGKEGRKRSAALGYGVTAVSHALLAITTTWPQVLVLRVSAWLGRGSRQPIKKAILANATAKSRQGRTFGLEQAFDSAGAVVGTFVAIAVLLWADLGYAEAFRTIFAISLIPAAVAVLVLVLFVRDRRSGRPSALPTVAPSNPPGSLPDGVRWFLVSEAVFGLGYFSILLALLRVGESLLPFNGGSIAAITALSLGLYLLYNIVFTAVALPAGRWADRAPGVGLVAASFGLFIGVDLLLILEGSSGLGSLMLLVGFAAFLVAGLQAGIQSVAESAWLARNVPADLAGRVFGRLGLIQGLAVLGGSLLVGGLWTYVNVPVAFTASAVLCAAGVALVVYAGQRQRGAPSPGTNALS